jgi:hypothetical protein
VLAPKEQATVMLVMDVSGSMNAIDVGFGALRHQAWIAASQSRGPVKSAT